MVRTALSALFALITLGIAACDQDAKTHVDQLPPADLIFVNGYVYTTDADRSVVDAVAIRDGEIIFVGADEEAKHFAGPETRVEDLGGRMLLPGLHDVHMHLFGIVDPDICTLESEPLSLPELAERVKSCIAHYKLPPGEWLTVDAWSFSFGNQPGDRDGEQLSSLRAALDAASLEHPILLWGNDGHHGAANSAALARAASRDGRRVGLSAETLRTVFASYSGLVATGLDGEPTGGLNEQARFLLEPPAQEDPVTRGPLLPQIGDKLAGLGLTSIQTPSLAPAFLPYLERFEGQRQMRFRLKVATRLDPIDYTDPETGPTDIDAMMMELGQIRTRFADSRLIAADAAKIYVDGVLEGDPFVVPPTLPNAAMLEPYLQPRFAYRDSDGVLTIEGYVDTGSDLCREVRARATKDDEITFAQTFLTQHGFHPDQCRISRGVFRDPVPFVHNYVARLNEAGFTIHIHVIGDRAARIAVDALEPAMDGVADNPLRHTLTHLQVVHPDDQARIGRLGLYLAITQAWTPPIVEYDMTVIPFIEEISIKDDLYDPDSYYMQNVYPSRSLMEAGGVLVGGSDAPVDDLSPRPFVNIALGVSRSNEQGQALNASEAVDIHDMIAAYTINGAHAMHQEDLVGSIEVGKRADLAVLDRNIVSLYDEGRPAEILETQVDMTVFDGEVIYQRR